MTKPQSSRAPVPAVVPVTISTVVLRVHADGTVTASVGGEALDPPKGAPGWRRSSFGHIIDQSSNNRAISVRVEVHEADGAIFTDLVPARSRKTRARAEPKHAHGKPPSGQALCTIGGDGFVPGEKVAIAVITGHTDAARTGSARAVIDRRSPGVEDSGGVEVMLFGRVSGTTIIRRLP